MQAKVWVFQQSDAGDRHSTNRALSVNRTNCQDQRQWPGARVSRFASERIDYGRGVRAVVVRSVPADGSGLARDAGAATTWFPGYARDKTFILEYFTFAEAEREFLGKGAIFPTTLFFEPRTQPLNR